jgi:predicted nucleic acid-binding protein
MCGPVAAELLSGARGETAVVLRARFRDLRWLPLAEPEDWYAAAELRAASTARGRPVMLVDTILAVVAMRARLRLLTLDRDFEAIAEIADGLDLRILSA